MRVFKTVVAIVAVVAVLGSGAFATKAWADSSAATTSQVNHNHSFQRLTRNWFKSKSNHYNK
ncbi:hypothetical protein L3X07_05140 [Levilactobacillus brevis]|nr:hypothetical protein [Levilactobacillus brevis]